MKEKRKIKRHMEIISENDEYFTVYVFTVQTQ